MLQALISITLWVLMAVGLLVIFYNEDPWYVPNASVISCISLLGDDQSKSLYIKWTIVQILFRFLQRAR